MCVCEGIACTSVFTRPSLQRLSPISKTKETCGKEALRDDGRNNKKKIADPKIEFEKCFED